MFTEEVFLAKSQLEANMNEPYYTVTQVSKMFDVTRQTIYNWIEQGRFPGKEEVGEGRGTVILIPDSNVEVVKKEEAAKLIAKLDHLGFHSASA